MLRKFCRIAHDTATHGFDIGAMIADEHHQQALRAAQFLQAVAFAIDARQVEIGGFPAKIAEGCLQTDHRVNRDNLRKIERAL